jgi:branched-subunit amino acid ABC-type transport system permease component
MIYLLALLPALVCVGLMLAAGVLGWLATRTRLGRRAQAAAHDTGAEA